MPKRKKMLKILISIQFILNLISRECRERKCIKMVKVSKLILIEWCGIVKS